MLDKIREIVVEQLGVDAEQVVPEANFVEDLGADSLDTVELIMAFEEEFDVEIPDTDAEKIKTSVLDMLDDISTHDDMVFMTKFLEMFIDKLGGFHE